MGEIYFFVFFYTYCKKVNIMFSQAKAYFLNQTANGCAGGRRASEVPQAFCPPKCPSGHRHSPPGVSFSQPVGQDVTVLLTLCSQTLRGS